MPLLIILSSVLGIQCIGCCANKKKVEKLVEKHTREKQVLCKTCVVLWIITYLSMSTTVGSM